MLPKAVIVGRPNVGKSTLFNKLVGRRTSLVADTPGVTRDRNEQEAQLRGRTVMLVDTAGLEEAAAETLSGRMHASATAAIEAADLVIFVVDARAGASAGDRHFAQWLRRSGKPVLLVANKVEGRSSGSVYDFYELALGDPVPVSAEHGEGIAHLMAEIVDRLPLERLEAKKDEDAPPIRLAIVGRPNAGKSTLVNSLLCQDRMITGPEPGLTRDAVKVFLEDRLGRKFELADTAGLRRRARVDAGIERMATHATIEALRAAEVVVLVIDATLGLEDQDLQIARLIESEGRGGVIVLNKWDAVDDQRAVKQAVIDRLQSTSANLKAAPVVTASGLTGAGTTRILEQVHLVWEMWNTRVQTAALNRWFETALSNHQPPMISGRRLKLRYITQAKARPPTFVVFGTRAEDTPEAYRRYLINSLRDELGLSGTPIRMHFRQPRNTFAES